MIAIAFEVPVDTVSVVPDPENVTPSSVTDPLPLPVFPVANARTFNSVEPVFPPNQTVNK
jgi:hypothetical protein